MCRPDHAKPHDAVNCHAYANRATLEELLDVVDLGGDLVKRLGQLELLVNLRGDAIVLVHKLILNH